MKHTDQPTKPSTIKRHFPTRRLSLLWALAGALLVASGLVYLNQTGILPLFWGRALLTDIRPELGFAYIAPTGRPEWSSHEHPSLAQVLEDGKPLPGPANVLHEDIRQVGLGRYSFWHDYVYFSASDNSDPCTNGRRYEVRTPLVFGQGVGWVVYAFTLLSMGLAGWVSRLWQAWVGKVRALARGAARAGKFTFGRLKTALLSMKARSLILLSIFLAFMVLFSLSMLYYQTSLHPEEYLFLWRREPLGEVRWDAGYRYLAANTHPELSSHEHPSQALLLENGQPLGPANELVEEVRDAGGGLFSIWNNTIYFSTSDNTDPLTNGRRYELAYPPATSELDVLRAALAGTGFLALAVGLALARSLPVGLLFPKIAWRKAWVASWVFLFMLQAYLALPIQVHAEIRTWWYIQTFSVDRFEDKGADYCAPPRPAQQNADKIEHIRQELSGVIRSKALLAIFKKVTAGATTDTEKHLLIQRFLQKLTYHTPNPPIYPNGELVYDPLVLIELEDMWCGQAAKVAIDLFAAAGYPGRLVQLGNHQIAEIFYDGDWHYFDADLFGNGESVLVEDGSIPSVAELSQGSNFTRLDALSAYQEGLVDDCLTPSRSSDFYPSFPYFAISAYQDVSLGYYYKTASSQEADADAYQYGWMTVTFTPNAEIRLAEIPERYPPNAPFLYDVFLDEDDMTLTIHFSSEDPDNDLLGYRVFVSERSRGWDYNHFYGMDSAEGYWANPGGWEPSMYENLFQIPPSEVALITLQSGETRVEFSVQHGKTYFISVMPFDEYGERIGRLLYPASNELEIEVK